MRSPVVFAVEVVLGLLLATVGAWVADRFSKKSNRQAVALERIAQAAENIAAGSEHLIHASKRRHASKAEINFIDKTPGCMYDAHVGSDNEIHPDYCRQ